MSSAATRITLVALAALFLLPLLLAWLMYSGVIDWRPGVTSNRGRLVNPTVEAAWPASFAQPGVTDAWILLYELPRDCDQVCLDTRTSLRQVRRALGRDASRVRVLYLAGKPTVEAGPEIDPDALVVRDGSGMLSAQLSEIGGRGVYLVDPLGNIMMAYDHGTDPNDIRLDLEHLLKYGKTDPR